MHSISPLQNFLITLLMSPATYIIFFGLVVGAVALGAMYGVRRFKDARLQTVPANMVPLKKYDAEVARLTSEIEQHRAYGDIMRSLAATRANEAEALRALQPSPFKFSGEPFTLDDAGIFADALEAMGWEVTDPEKENKAVDELFELLTTFLERHQLAVVGVPLNQQTRWIMVQPNYRCAGYAAQLRAIGHEINRKSEDEQAHVLHWMLNLYFEHGDKWRNVAQNMLAAKRAPAAAAANDASDKVAANG